MNASALSQQLRRLEAEVGIDVVAPEGRGVGLTEAGRALAKAIAAVGEAVSEVERGLAARSGREICLLRLGVAMTTLPVLLAPALARLTRGHFSLETHIVDGEARDYVEAVSESRLDAAHVESWPEDEVGARARLVTRVGDLDPVDFVVPAGPAIDSLTCALEALGPSDRRAQV